MGEESRLTPAEKTVDYFLQKFLHNGKLTVQYPSGFKKSYGRGSNSVKVEINKLPLLKLRNPALLLGESYMNGTIEIPESDLDGLFKLLSDNDSDSALVKLTERLPKRQSNRYNKQKQQISHHYDIGNDYYKLWLDETLTYSCAYFHKWNDSLETAQQQKVEHLLKKLQLKPGQTMLDIGSGWGHLAVTAAKKYKVNVLGITLSQEQLASSKKLAKDQGLAGRVKFKLLNYQDLPDNRKFDRVISVGMYEHVGRKNQEEYFKKVRRILKDDGISVLHSITQKKDKEVSPWVDKYIFPGGYLPTVQDIESNLAKYGFWSIDRENLWQHYARTLDIWRRNHQKNKSKFITMFDERFYRMQDFWLAGSAAAFRHAGTGLNQFIFTKLKPEYKTWPPTRVYLHKSS